MAISTSGITFLCILFIGLSIALIEIKEKRSEVEQTKRVSTPKFVGLNTRHQEGPWPECLQLNGEACLTLLKLYTEGLDIELVKPGEDVEEYFHQDRVRVYVDEFNAVIAIPKRG